MQPSCETTKVLQDTLYGSIVDALASKYLFESCKNVQICDGNGTCVVIPNYGQRSEDNHTTETQYHVKRVLLTLTYALEGNERLNEITRHVNTKSVSPLLTEENLSQFLTKHYKEDSLVIATLKCMSKVWIKTSNKTKKNSQTAKKKKGHLTICLLFYIIENEKSSPRRI